MHLHIYCSLLGVGILLCLGGCDFKVEEPKESPVVPQGTPEPTPESTPEPIPEATPEAVKRLAPDGVFFVTQSFSVTTETGILSFPPGRQVSLVRTEGEAFVVTDGEIEGRAPATFFTNDLDEAEAISTKLDGLADAHRAWVNQHREMANQRKTEEHESAQAFHISQQEGRYEAQVSLLRRQLDSLESRIKAAGEERVSKGFPRYGGKRENLYYKGDRVSVALSSDASRIEQLLQERDGLRAKLSQAESAR